MLEFGFKSDKGKIREINEDAFFVIPEDHLFLVADGVGGHVDGELASRMAMTEIAAKVREKPLSENAEDEEIRDYFMDLVSMANEHIYESAKEPSRKSMATTIILLYLCRGNAYVVNVGDSRAYLVRNGEMMQISEDHTFVNDLVRQGVITEAEALTHPDRNMITRALGAEHTVKPDFFRFHVEKEDVILLCTDGLYNEVDEYRICEMVCEEKNMRKLCSDLVQEAYDNGGHDNITVVTVSVGESLLTGETEEEKV